MIDLVHLSGLELVLVDVTCDIVGPCSNFSEKLSQGCFSCFIFCSYIGKISDGILCHRPQNGASEKLVNYQILSRKDLAKSILSQGGWSDLVVLTL